MYILDDTHAHTCASCKQWVVKYIPAMSKVIVIKSW